MQHVELAIPLLFGGILGTAFSLWMTRSNPLPIARFIAPGLGWAFLLLAALWRIVAVAPDLTQTEFKLAAYQAILKTRITWDDDYQPDPKCLEQTPIVRTEWDVGVAECETSSWGYSGAILAWSDPVLGPQARLLFGPLWTLYQEHWRELGLPSDVPRPLSSSPKPDLVQHFSSCKRIIVRSEGPDGGMAFIEQRSTPLLRIPGLCIDEIPWIEDTYWERVSEVDSNAPRTYRSAGDILESTVVPFDGVLTPLSSVQIFLITLVMFLTLGLAAAISGRASQWGCLLILLGISLALPVFHAYGVWLMRTGVYYAYSNPLDNTPPKLVDIDEDTDPRKRLQAKIPDEFAVGPAVEWVLTWDERLDDLKREYARDASKSPISVPVYVIFSGYAGLIGAPIWIGMGLGGTFGARVGMILEGIILIQFVLASFIALLPQVRKSVPDKRSGLTR